MTVCENRDRTVDRRNQIETYERVNAGAETAFLRCGRPAVDAAERKKPAELGSAGKYRVDVVRSPELPTPPQHVRTSEIANP
ncbi:MAG: hypothetical protein LWW93_04415 [Hyphomicrobiales bacterium]|nr:hypothetical protein [Hyphomicrobiales bacterium]